MDRILPAMGASQNGDPDVQLTCVSNLFFRRMHFKNAGDIEHGHSHPFDHVSFVSRGSVRVTVGTTSKVFHEPQAIFIKKELQHEIEALEDDSVVVCIHAIRDGGRVEDIIDPDSYVIPPGAEGVKELEIGKDYLMQYIAPDLTE